MLEQIQKQFPDIEYSTYESDLYVKAVDGVEQWLKENYKYYTNIKPFTSEIDKTRWLDIPFGYMIEHCNKRHVTKL
jgi:hypothetical protein